MLRPVVDAAISLGVSFGAHVDALATAYTSTSTAYVIPGVAAVIEIEQQRAAERSATALAAFETAARNAGISYQCRSIENLPEQAASALGDAARLYDLTVVLQPDATLDSFDNTTATQVLLQSGGPVLFVPHIFRGSFEPKRIGICWDGSRLAGRAFRDARDFLSRADAVVAISVDGSQVAPAEATGQKLVQHMGRAGLAASLIELPAEHPEIQPTILSLAADENLDMLVMGAYGHSRLREGILGGVTREMLKTMTVPTLMSH
ncbi:universal stress protein [Bradyrhizobium sp. CCGUVB23]|uniref:universal stress protein n=1 Tax=Bradyrhizobium sp. CCGUVB23 TaxID=2949630 RepID=UPI0020B25E2D|nr:universal stress protein [Bradyrhizobium sp. CCGUVB23]MCP3463352.1 universal stress protein [Bradyrhizobium sp. CCGUVB23]